MVEAVGGVASMEEGSAVAKEPLNASSRAAGPGGLSVHSCGGHATSELDGGGQHAGRAARSDACGFCFHSLGAQFIVCSGCKRLHAETICVGVDEKVILILLEDTLGAVKFCCCGCRMVPSRESQDVGGGVALGYAQLLRVVGTLVDQVRSLMGNGTEWLKGMYASPGETRSNEESFSR